jgi:hypothetical protein
MSKKHKKNKKQPFIKDLEYFIVHFNEHCERCGQKLDVHGYRSRSKQKREAVYASCQNKGKCARSGLEICFVGNLGC